MRWSTTWKRPLTVRMWIWCISATPIDLTRIIKVNKPMQRVRYELQEIGTPTLEDILREKFGKK